MLQDFPINSPSGRLGGHSAQGGGEDYVENFQYHASLGVMKALWGLVAVGMHSQGGNIMQRLRRVAVTTLSLLMLGLSWLRTLPSPSRSPCRSSS